MPSIREFNKAQSIDKNALTKDLRQLTISEVRNIVSQQIPTGENEFDMLLWDAVENVWYVGNFKDLVPDGLAAGDFLIWDSINEVWNIDNISNYNKENFTELLDTPGDYTSQAGKFLKVTDLEDGLEFTDAPGGGLVYWEEDIDITGTYKKHIFKPTSIDTNVDISIFQKGAGNILLCNSNNILYAGVRNILLGGEVNSIGDISSSSLNVIAGGTRNKVRSGTGSNALLGGNDNIVSSGASGRCGILGGQDNDINQSYNAIILGGQFNDINAGGSGSVLSGYYAQSNKTCQLSHAAFQTSTYGAGSAQQTTLHLGGTTLIGYDIEDNTKTADVNNDANWAELFLDNAGTQFEMELNKGYAIQVHVNAMQDQTLTGPTAGSYTAGTADHRTSLYAIRKADGLYVESIYIMTQPTGHPLDLGFGHYDKLRLKCFVDNVLYPNKLIFKAYGIQHDGLPVTVRWHVVLTINEVKVSST